MPTIDEWSNSMSSKHTSTHNNMLFTQYTLHTKLNFTAGDSFCWRLLLECINNILLRWPFKGSNMLQVHIALKKCWINNTCAHLSVFVWYVEVCPLWQCLCKAWFSKYACLLPNVPSITFFLRYTKQYNHYISFKTVPSFNSTLQQWLSRSLKHFWKPFCESLFSYSITCSIMLAASQMYHPFNAYICQGYW